MTHSHPSCHLEEACLQERRRPTQKQRQNWVWGNNLITSSTWIQPHLIPSPVFSVSRTNKSPFLAEESLPWVSVASS